MEEVQLQALEGWHTLVVALAKEAPDQLAAIANQATFCRFGWLFEFFVYGVVILQYVTTLSMAVLVGTNLPLFPPFAAS